MSTPRCAIPLVLALAALALAACETPPNEYRPPGVDAERLAVIKGRFSIFGREGVILTVDGQPTVGQWIFCTDENRDQASTYGFSSGLCPSERGDPNRGKGRVEVSPGRHSVTAGVASFGFFAPGVMVYHSTELAFDAVAGRVYEVRVVDLSESWFDPAIYRSWIEDAATGEVVAGVRPPGE